MPGFSHSLGIIVGGVRMEGGYDNDGTFRKMEKYVAWIFQVYKHDRACKLKGHHENSKEICRGWNSASPCRLPSLLVEDGIKNA